MKTNILLVLLFFLIPVISKAQTQEATTSNGQKVILSDDGTWKYVEEGTTSDGKKVILNADGTWNYSGKIQEDKGISYNLQGRGVFALLKPKYDYSEGGRVVVEVSVDREGKVVQAIPGTKGSTTLNDYLLKVAKEAAMGTIFEVKADAPAIQKGTITYNFVVN